MTDDQDPSLSTGAYALHALTEEEAAEFEAHLARSESLRSEVAEMTDTAVALGLASTPVPPPVDMRARLMGLVAQTPQLPAVPATAARPDAPAEAARPVLAAVPSAPVSAAAPSARTPSAMPVAERAEARWFRRPGTLLAAAAAAIAVFVGGVFLGSELQGQDAASLQQAQAQASALAELYAAPDARRASADVAEDSTATLVWSGELDRSAVVFDELDTLPEDRVYQAWYIDAEGTATPAGTFEANDDVTFRVLDGSLTSGTVVGVTVEPEGGSEAPTTDPIVAIEAA